MARFAPRPLAALAGIDVNLTDAAVTALLTTRCNLVPSHDDPDRFYLQEGARIHTEDELITMIGPDAVCAVESMRAGLVQLDAVGLQRYEELAKCPLDKLQLVAQVGSPRARLRVPERNACATCGRCTSVLTQRTLLTRIRAGSCAHRLHLSINRIGHVSVECAAWGAGAAAEAGVAGCGAAGGGRGVGGAVGAYRELHRLHQEGHAKDVPLHQRCVVECTRAWA